MGKYNFYGINIYFVFKWIQLQYTNEFSAYTKLQILQKMTRVQRWLYQTRLRGIPYVFSHLHKEHFLVNYALTNQTFYCVIHDVRCSPLLFIVIITCLDKCLRRRFHRNNILRAMAYRILLYKLFQTNVVWQNPGHMHNRKIFGILS